MQTKPNTRLGIVYQAQVVMAWKEMLALRPGIHGLPPRHAFSCPTALLPAGSCPRSVSVPTDKEGRVTSEIHADELVPESKKTLPVLRHGLVVGFTSSLSYRYLPCAQCQSRRSRVVPWFCLVLCRGQGSPEHVGAFRLTGMRRSKVEEEGNPQQNRM